jgi:hypothetical protein
VRRSHVDLAENFDPNDARDVFDWLVNARDRCVTVGGECLPVCVGGAAACDQAIDLINDGDLEGAKLAMTFQCSDNPDDCGHNWFETVSTIGILYLTGRAASGVGALAPASRFGQLKHSGYGIQAYSSLTGVTAGRRGTIQAHHLIEQRFASLMGGNTDDWLSIVVTRAEHTNFTNAWRTAIPYGSGTILATRAQVENAARQIYAEYPEILKALAL